MNHLVRNLRIGAAVVALIMVLGVLLWGGERDAAAVSVAQLQAAAEVAQPVSVKAEAPAAQKTDPRIIDVLPIQSIEDEPLILGKSTVVRVLVGSVATTTAPINISAALNFDGQQLQQSVTLTTTQQYVDFYPNAPSELRTVSISAQITPASGVADGDKGNNSMQISVPTIRMPAKTVVKIFYLPVDWTGVAREINEFETYFPAYVKENTDFVRAAYPMPDDQVIAESTNVPHILTPAERELADRQYNSDNQAFLRFGGSIVLTAREYAPDAELIAAVLPPHWLQEHESRSALGFASSAFPGTTFVLLWGPQTMVIGHEYGHLRNLIDDYDFGGSRNVTGYYADTPGFWVAHKQPINLTPDFEVWNMMSSAAYNGDYHHFWIDRRSYEHLIANYISGGGEASEPMVLASTILDPTQGGYKGMSSTGAPLFASAGQNFFEPGATIGLTVASIDLSRNDKLKVVWKRAGQVVSQEEKNPASAGFGYTVFTLKGKGKEGLALGRYDVETYLNDELVKTARFFVEPDWTPAFNIDLGDNNADATQGYRAGMGVSASDKQAGSMFVDFVSAQQQSVYGWFVGIADGASPNKDLKIDLKFIGPDGKEYQSTALDRDGQMTLAQTLGTTSYVRERLDVAGKSVAELKGGWTLQAWQGDKMVGSSTFSLIEGNAGSATDTAADLLDSMGYRLIRISDSATGADDGSSLVTMNVEAITEDLSSSEFIKQVWDNFAAAKSLYPTYETYRLKIPVDERYSLYLELKRSGWEAIAGETPNWDTLRDQDTFIVKVRDDLRFDFLSEEDAVQFLEDRLR